MYLYERQTKFITKIWVISVPRFAIIPYTFFTNRSSSIAFYHILVMRSRIFFPLLLFQVCSQLYKSVKTSIKNVDLQRHPAAEYPFIPYFHLNQLGIIFDFVTVQENSYHSRTCFMGLCLRYLKAEVLRYWKASGSSSRAETNCFIRSIIQCRSGSNTFRVPSVAPTWLCSSPQKARPAAANPTWGSALRGFLLPQGEDSRETWQDRLESIPRCSSRPRNWETW